MGHILLIYIRSAKGGGVNLRLDSSLRPFCISRLLTQKVTQNTMIEQLQHCLKRPLLILLRLRSDSPTEKPDGFSMVFDKHIITSAESSPSGTVTLLVLTDNVAV